MEENWKSYGAPLAVVMATGIWAFSLSRIFYGVDLVHEARHVLFQLDLLNGDGLFRKDLDLDQIVQLLAFPGVKLWQGSSLGAESEGLVLFLREFRLMASVLVAVLLALCFRHRVPVTKMFLFAAPLISFLPLGLPGVHPLSMGSLLVAWIVVLAWRWYQHPTAVTSWLLPLCGLLLGVALPELVPVMLLGVLLLLLRRSQPEDPALSKIHLAASLNLTLILGFFAVRAVNMEGLREAWSLQSRVLGFPWQQISDWHFPSQSLVLGVVLMLTLALLSPSRFFHPCFAVLCVGVAAWGVWSDPSNGILSAELVVVLLAPLVLSHFWKIRKSLPADFRMRVVVTSCLVLGSVLFFTRGIHGLAAGLLPLFILFFASGWIRELRLSVLFSAFTFSMLLVVAQYAGFPSGQSRRESLDLIESGAYQGLWTTRPVSLEVKQYLSAIKEFPSGPSSIFVYDNLPGLYLLSGLERATFLYRLPQNRVLHDELRAYFGDAGNLPDAVFAIRTPQSPETSPEASDDPFYTFFETHPDYRSLQRNDKYQIFVKAEFIEQEMKRRE